MMNATLSLGNLFVSYCDLKLFVHWQVIEDVLPTH